jgi:cytochrome c1
MKNIRSIFAVSLFIIVVSACHRGKHVTIRSNTNGAITSIEYYGKIVFTEDNTGIKNMAPNSYIEFKKNDEKISAQRNADGSIIYDLHNGTKTNTLNNENKQLITEVLKGVGKLNKN